MSCWIYPRKIKGGVCLNQYWEQRKYNEQMALLNTSEQKLLNRLRREYLRMQKEIIADLENLYYKILAEGGSDVALTSHLYQFNGYYETLNHIQQKLIEMGSNNIETIESSFTKLYKDNGNRITKQFNLPFDDSAAKDVVNKIWAPDKKVWSTRIWEHQGQLRNRLNNTLIDAVARGVNPDTLVKNLMVDFGVGFYEAQRLVRTEENYILNQSAVEGYKDAGVEYFEVLSDQAHDEECSPMNGKRFRLEDMQVGVNCPPFHPNCRCCVLGVLD